MDSRFRTQLWNSKDFKDRVKRIIYDEAHCILDWGDFRPSYQRLCFLRPTIPHATVLALTATATDTMIAEIKTQLGISSFEVVRLSNDRWNTEYVVKKMDHTLQSFHDLAFLVPQGGEPLEKFMVFVDSKLECERVAEFLRQRLPPEKRHKIVWVHADMTQGFNEQALNGLRDGSIYGVVCTDVAGMVSLCVSCVSRASLTIFRVLIFQTSHLLYNIGCQESIVRYFSALVVLLVTISRLDALF